MNSPKKLHRTDTALVLVDIQEKLFPAMRDGETLLQNARKLLDAAALLGLPVLVTEQYPAGIGPTLPDLKEAAGGAPVFEKLAFSVWGSPAFRDALNDLDVNRVLLAGIEMHICVAQSTLDLVRHGYDVFVARDASSSRREGDFVTAEHRLRQAGAIVTTTEAALFELLEEAGTEEFKQVLKIIK
jgi:nicotinamidase-related amidase